MEKMNKKEYLNYLDEKIKNSEKLTPQEQWDVDNVHVFENK